MIAADYPRRALAAVTGAALLFTAAVLGYGPESVLAGKWWAVAVGTCGAGLCVLAAAPSVPVTARATLAAVAVTVLLARAAAFVFLALARPIDGVAVIVGGFTWLALAAHTSALLVLWDRLASPLQAKDPVG